MFHAAGNAESHMHASGEASTRPVGSAYAPLCSRVARCNRRRLSPLRPRLLHVEGDSLLYVLVYCMWKACGSQCRIAGAYPILLSRVVATSPCMSPLQPSIVSVTLHDSMQFHALCTLQHA